MTPTAVLIRAAAHLETDHRLGREPRSEAILSGLGATAQPLPKHARDAARRHLATAEWLRSWALHEPEERAAALRERADGQDLLAALTLRHGERQAA